MELIYLYVEDYKNIKNQGFNFSPRFRCSYDGKNLIIEENKDYINIFPDNINITAIVGENGSGKSSVFEILSKILNTQNDINYFYILNDGAKNQIYSNNIKLNISETYELNIPFHMKNNKPESNLNPKVSLNRYIDMSYLNISHLERDGIIKNDLPNPENPISYYGIYAKNDFNVKEYGEISFYPNLSYFNLEQFNLFQTFTIGNLLKQEEYKELFFKLFKIKQPYSLSIEYDKDVLNKIKEDNTPNNDTSRIVDSSIPSNIDKLLKFLDVTGDNILIENKNYEEFFKLLFSVYKLEDKFRFTFKTKSGEDIKLSSGEKTILFYLERISFLLSKDNEKSRILLFDEIELYLHPNWQKRILKIIIDFINQNKKSKKLHIILASHSPFILSDIPKENVIFLEKDKETNNSTNVTEKMKDFKTFGANIHTLLSNGFFMSDGLMGEFAKSKIEEVIKFLNDEKSEINSKEEAQKIINIIGEPILKSQLQKMLDSKRLEKIDKVDELEEEIKLLKYRLEIMRKNQ